MPWVKVALQTNLYDRVKEAEWKLIQMHIHGIREDIGGRIAVEPLFPSEITFEMVSVETG